MPLAADLVNSKMLKHLRASVRLDSRVPVAIEWTENGREFRAEGYTVDVSPRGCRAMVPQAFTIGQHFRLCNLTNEHTSEALLVWRGQEGRSGWELGIALQNPPLEFWGVDF